ncbi:MAG: YraN family protein [Candidatus Saccharibacteria bacterium]|nr:YraN family protein [Candidatus Saccharibacteria bacterium]
MSSTTKTIGDSGEDRACEYLRGRKFKIIERNWRTRYCEIDIIAKKKKRLYFVEVKTRKSSDFGRGEDYVTPKKLQQMKFAAEAWVNTNQWKGEYQLAVIGITGEELNYVEVLYN